MQITIDFPDALLHQAEVRAAQKGLAVDDLIASYVARGLQRDAEVRQRSSPPRIAKAVTGWPIPALSVDEMAELEIQEDLDLHPNILEFEGRKAFVVLSYAEYLEIEEQLQELEDIKTLRHAKELEADAPTISLAEMRASYGLHDAEA
jgi:PHD/YefM family antitoxin component YafN of YafNO toxin-antitoxin module